MSERINIIGELFKKNNIPSFRLQQVIKSIYDSKTTKYSKINTLPLKLREIIIENLGDNISTLNVIKKTYDTQVEKILFETSDKQQVESVCMEYLSSKERANSYMSLCISSQVGCALGCKFCATGSIGFKKHLTVDEIIDQFLYFKKEGFEIKNVSFMGMGEPFLNPNIWSALGVLTDTNQIGLGQQKINISTVGIIEGINKIREAYPQINLAFSLHSPFAKQREAIMPISKQYSIEKVFSALNKHISKSNNKIFIAYALIDQVNDSIIHAKELAKLIKSQGKKWYLYHVNLIRYNPWGDVVDFKSPNNSRVNVFLEILQKSDIQVTLRKTFGDKIDAACGQLAAR